MVDALLAYTKLFNAAAAGRPKTSVLSDTEWSRNPGKGSCTASWLLLCGALPSDVGGARLMLVYFRAVRPDPARSRPTANNRRSVRW